jgi:hypothetical protein
LVPIFENHYVAALNEEALLTHRFPCTNEINDMQKYNHAYNVDFEKMNEEWKEIYNTLAKYIYFR